MRLHQLQQLLEFAPSRTAFNQILNDTSILMGFECELVTNEYAEDRDSRMEIDYDNMDWNDVGNYVHITRRLQARIDDKFSEWRHEKIDDELSNMWDDVSAKYLVKYCVENGYLDADPAERQDEKDVIQQHYSEAHQQFLDDERESLLDNFDGDIDDMIRENYHNSVTEFMDDLGIDYPTHEEEDDYGEGGTDVESVYSNMADDLRSVVGRQVHYTAGLYNDKDMADWHIEEDGSLDGGEYVTAEVSSAVYPVGEGVQMLQRTFQWMQDSGYHTNKTTGLHVSFSIEGMDEGNFDFLKMMVLFDENYTAQIFKRLNAYYAKQMRTVLFKNLKNTPNAIQTMSSRDLATTIVKLHEIAQKMNFGGQIGPGMSKYFTFRHRAGGVVEFRSMGGAGYDKQFDIIRKRIVNMAYLMRVGSNPTMMAREYVEKVYRMLTTEKFSEPQLDASKNRESDRAIPRNLSTFAPIIDKNKMLRKWATTNPTAFVYNVVLLLSHDEIQLSRVQIAQLRLYIQIHKITAEMLKAAGLTDDLYNRFAQLVKLPLAVVGHPDQKVMPFVRQGAGYTPGPEPEEPADVDNRGYRNRLTR